MDAFDLWRGRGTQRSLLNDVWNLMSEFDRPLLTDTNRQLIGYQSEGYAPACDVSENQDTYNLSLDMPGISKDNIDIEVTGNQLTISGQRKKEKEFSEDRNYRLERSFGLYKRTFVIPEGVNTEMIQANYEDGVLRVSIPKAEKEKAKKIEIGSGGRGFLKKLTQKSEPKAVNS